MYLSMKTPYILTIVYFVNIWYYYSDAMYSGWFYEKLGN